MTEQDAYDADGNPFPTTYYLTCSYLVEAVARIEAAGGVERWSARVGADDALRASLERATDEQREVRRALAAGGPRADAGASLDLGIGGSRNPPQLKCLHAHVAFALARPGYALGDAMLAEIEPAWPGECCTATHPATD